MAFADLHVHTIFSDGTSTPDELIRDAQKGGLSALSVVDHDSIGGIEPTIQAAQSARIEILPGIELSTELENLEVHILGYLFDYENEDLLRKLKLLKKTRIERIYKILDKLKPMGVNLRPETVFEISGNGTPGRLHVARAMIQERFVSNVGEAFQRYIGDRCPAYVLGFRFSSFEAIQLIKAVGGIPVLAHPYLLARNELILSLIDGGLMGLEVYYPEHSQAHINYYLDICRQHNLLVTGGSDFHGIAKPEVQMGIIKIPYELVEKLKEAKHG